MTAIDVSKAFTSSELGNDLGHQNLAGLCLTANTEGRMDSRAKQASFRLNGLTRVDANTHVNRVRGMPPIVLGKSPLDGDGACNSA